MNDRVSLTGEKAYRGHLKVASGAAAAARSRSRASLVVRSVLLFLRIAWVNVVAVLGAVMAFLPLAMRRRPIGSRTSAPRTAARVIPLAEKRRAQNR